MLNKWLIRLLLSLFVLFSFFEAFSTEALAKGQLAELKALNTLEQAVKQNQWGKAESQFKQLDATSKKNLWKYQMLSEETEYGTMQNELTKLYGAIIAHDRTQALVETSFLHSLYKRIYTQ